MVFLILKLIIVFFFLIMFIRRPNIVWGIGLLTVTTAVLLDTLLGTFNREELLADLGFFYYIISGVLFAGAAAWFWGLVRPYLPASPDQSQRAVASTPVLAPKSENVIAPPPPLPAGHEDGYAAAGIDRRMLFEQIHGRFSFRDIRDLMFDLEINELDVVVPGQSVDELIINIMDEADRQGRADSVALAVERILTPPPSNLLPRVEKLTPESPRTVLRHFLLANYNMTQLKKLTGSLGIDWEQLQGNDKKDKVRELLLYLYRRNQIGDLIQALQSPERVKN